MQSIRLCVMNYVGIKMFKILVCEMMNNIKRDEIDVICDVMINVLSVSESARQFATSISFHYELMNQVSRLLFYIKNKSQIISLYFKILRHLTIENEIVKSSINKSEMLHLMSVEWDIIINHYSVLQELLFLIQNMCVKCDSVTSAVGSGNATDNIIRYSVNMISSKTIDKYGNENIILTLNFIKSISCDKVINNQLLNYDILNKLINIINYGIVMKNNDSLISKAYQVLLNMSTWPKTREQILIKDYQAGNQLFELSINLLKENRMTVHGDILYFIRNVSFANKIASTRISKNFHELLHIIFDKMIDINNVNAMLYAASTILNLISNEEKVV